MGPVHVVHWYLSEDKTEESRIGSTFVEPYKNQLAFTWGIDRLELANMDPHTYVYSDDNDRLELWDFLMMVLKRPTHWCF